MIKLLRPQQSAQRLSHHVARIARELCRDDGRVELVRFTLPLYDHPVELSIDRTGGAIREPEADGLRLARADHDPVMRGRLCPCALRIHCVARAVNQEI